MNNETEVNIQCPCTVMILKLGSKELLRVVIKSGEYQIQSIQQLFEKLDRTHRTRSRRQINPLHAVGDLVDWTFGGYSYQ